MIKLGETNEYATEIPFTLPLVTDPLTGLTSWSFTLGEVQIRLPGAVTWISVPTSKIIEKGYGRFAARLTAAQTLGAGIVPIRAAVAGAQPYVGYEVIADVVGGDIPQNGEGYFMFYLPNADDPVFSAPVTGHIFNAGEVRICLPDSSYTDADPADVFEFGNGAYGLRLHGAATERIGKAYLYAAVAGAQRFEDYAEIYNALSPSGGGPVVEPPETIPSPIQTSSPEYRDHVTVAVRRLPRMYRTPVVI